MEIQTAPKELPDYSVIFAKVDEAGNAQLLDDTRVITAQAETIEMIARATEQVEMRHFVTFLSS